MIVSKKRIIFRADGNSIIGLGHVVRSLALVQMLRSHFECIFAIQAPDEALQQEINKWCHGLIILPLCPPEDDRFVHELSAYVSKEELVVLDGYHFKTDYQQQLKNSGCTLICIDDIHAFPFVADAVLNHGTLNPAPYHIAFYTKLLLGPRFALLRPPFLQRLQDNNIKREGVFLCFGGSDPQNLTLRFLQVLAASGQVSHIEVVVGSAYHYFSQLQAFAQQQDSTLQIHVHQNISAEKMAFMMATCAIAVVPGSSIALECASMGLHLVCGYYAENQKGILKMLAENGAAINVGNFLELEAEQLNEAIRKFQEQPLTNPAREQLFGNQDPAENILNEFRKLEQLSQLQIRRAQSDDTDTYYNWANDPATRANAINPEPIPYEAHVRWFAAKLKTEQSYLYLCSLGGTPVGQVRFDAENGAYLIDYAVSPSHRGMGLGRAIMAKCITRLQEEEPFSPIILKAKVKHSNIASLKVFESLHFAEKGSESINGDAYTLYELKLEARK